MLLLQYVTDQKILVLKKVQQFKVLMANERSFPVPRFYTHTEVIATNAVASVQFIRTLFFLRCKTRDKKHLNLLQAIKKNKKIKTPPHTRVKHCRNMQKSEGAFLREGEWSSGALSLQSVGSEEESHDFRVNVIHVRSSTSAAAFN